MDKQKITILIDNGHGVETPGKCSPDSKLKEWAWTREVASAVVAELCAEGYDARRLVTEAADISINERCRRVNAVCAEKGSDRVVLVSIHVNAAGSDGKWRNARGWLCMVDDAASLRARRFAGMLFDAAEAEGIRTRQHTAAHKYYLYSQALGKPNVRLGILRGTKCPAVLTENLFMDNHEDCWWLLRPEGKAAVVRLHVEAIKRYVTGL